MTSVTNDPPVTAPAHELEEKSHDSEVDIKDDTQSADPGKDEVQTAENGLARVASGPAYSVFPMSMIRWIVAMHCISAFMSPITGNIYFPAIPALARDLRVSTEEINLTLTTYMIFQGLSPTLFGDFADAAGRRPAFIIAFLIYLGANIGLALQRSYAALLVLRMVQSGGSSGTIALVYGVVADIIPSSERGKWMGFVGSGITIGPAIGPVGGLLSAYLGWAWIFWFLIILTVAWLIPYTIAVPETARKIVGNGSIPPPLLNMSLIDYLRFRNRPRSASESMPKRKIPFPNPLNTLKVLRHKDMAMILGYNACLFVCFVTVTATLSSQFQQIYGYDELILGLFYLPIGGATMIASICGGYLADWNFRRIAKNIGFPLDRKRGSDMSEFPLEQARIQLIAPLIFVGGAACIGYGWALERQTSVVVPVVLAFFIGLCVTWPFQIMNLLIVDTYPSAPATATAANNLIRCLGSAVSTAVIDLIITRIGRGWAYTLLALLIILPSPVLYILVKHGQGWRKERVQKMKEEMERKNAAAAGGK
ncbi:chloramphenicol resistance protein [Xylaria sp. CBS 124048]|nr:chloramphenicol resistance protein [Xylaria sp. CBS 124048]